MAEYGSLEFFQEMVDYYHKFYQAKHGRNYTDQRPESAKGIYDLTVAADPDQVIEIGTCHGASTTVIAAALKKLGKDLRCMLSIDRSHASWEETKRDILPVFQSSNGIDLGLIRCMDADFMKVDPKTIIGSEKVMVFYDIHDLPNFRPSKKFVSDWIPLLGGGVVAVHDVVVVGVDFVPGTVAWEASTLYHFDSTRFSGYLELESFMDWMNQNNVPIGYWPDGIFFNVGKD